VPARHFDVLDSIYGDWREGLRSPEIVPVREKQVYRAGRLGQVVWEWAETEVGKRVVGARDKFTMGNPTPALLTSSS
jgi:hypothetical protein